MNKFFILIFLILLLFGCSKNVPLINIEELINAKEKYDAMVLFAYGESFNNSHAKKIKDLNDLIDLKKNNALLLKSYEIYSQVSSTTIQQISAINMDQFAEINNSFEKERKEKIEEINKKYEATKFNLENARERSNKINEILKRISGSFSTEEITNLIKNEIISNPNSMNTQENINNSPQEVKKEDPGFLIKMEVSPKLLEQPQTPPKQ